MVKQSSHKLDKRKSSNISKLLRLVKLARTKQCVLKLSESAMQEAEKTFKQIMKLQKHIKKEFNRFLN